MSSPGAVRLAAFAESPSDGSPELPEKVGAEGLPIGHFAAGDQGTQFVGGKDRDLEVLAGLEPLGDGRERGREEDMHLLVGEAGRGVEGAEWLDPARGVTGLLLELAARGVGRILAGLELARAEFEEPRGHGEALVADEDELPIVADGDDGHGAGVADDILDEGRGAWRGRLEMVAFDAEDAADVRRLGRAPGGRGVARGAGGVRIGRCIDLRADGHGVDDTEMPSEPNSAAQGSERLAPPADAADAARTATVAAAPSEAPVRLIGLEKRFGRTPVLRGVTLDFPRGKTTVVLGPSGCGKSVMLKHIVGLIRPDRGQVFFEGRRVDTLSERALAPVRRRFGFLFQQGALFDSMSVRDNIAFPLRELASGRTGVIGEALGDLVGGARSGDIAYEEERRVRRVLRLVGLEELIDRMPSELSGGQQKRIALARAVVLDPEVILYDEPTTGLDPIRSDVINELILKLKQELGATGIVVTHDLVSAFKVADHMVMLHEGQVILEGPPAAFRDSRDPVVSRFLRGEASEDELRAIREVTAANAESARSAKDARLAP